MPVTKNSAYFLRSASGVVNVGAATAPTAGQALVATSTTAATWSSVGGGGENVLINGNFINNSTNGYGSTPDDWTSSSANPVQGGIPTLTKQQVIDLLGVSDGDIEGLWNLNGNFNDLSSNGYNLTPSGSPTDTSDGLMAQAKVFAAASSQYASNAAANCRIAGNQTLFCFFKPTTIGSVQRIMGIADSSATNAINIEVTASGNPRSYITGLTSSTLTSSNVMEASKWYMLVLVYDSSNSLVKVWCNGIKTEASVTGSHTAGTGDFAVGRLGAYNAEYANGTIQCAGVLSVALSDNQVKRLFAATLYRGQKIRRATTDGLLYQDLPQDLVERLRGKTVTLSASVYAESTNHRIYIDDGTVTASSPTAANTWEEVSVTRTISSTATQIRVGLEADTTDGNMWIEEVRIGESDSALPYNHSDNDWSRFPRLLRMDIPSVVSGYQFEENRWYNWTTTWTGFSVSPELGGSNTAKWNFSGEEVWLFRDIGGSGGTSNSTSKSVSVPVVSAAGTPNPQLISPALVSDNGSLLSTPGYGELAASGTTMSLYKTFYQGAWTGSGACTIYFPINSYRID